MEDLAHQAELMQQVAARRLAMATDPETATVDPSRDPAVLTAYWQRFSLAAVGAVVSGAVGGAVGAAAGSWRTTLLKGATLSPEPRIDLEEI